MSDFIQGFTESMAHQGNVTSAYGQNLMSNASRTAATVMDLNASWRGPGYTAAAAVGDGWQAGVRPHHARVDNRSAAVSQTAGMYDNQMSSEVHVMGGIGALTA
jgi:hypothetical protein